MIKSSCLSCQKLVQCLPAARQGGGRLQGRCCWGLSSRGWGQKRAAVGAFSSAPIWSPGARCFRNMANVGAHSPGRCLTEQASGWNTHQEPNVQHVFSDPLTLPFPQFPPVCPVLKMTAVLPYLPRCLNFKQNDAHGNIKEGLIKRKTVEVPCWLYVFSL